MTQTRETAVRRRWWDIVKLAVVGACAVVVGTPLAVSLAGAKLPVLETAGWLAWIAVPVLLGAALWPFARGRWIAWLGLRHPFSYPPTWVAGSWGAALVLLLSRVACEGGFPVRGIVSAW